MVKLVILNQGMTSRVHELNVDRTTIGRVEDNTFQIPDPSVSSHHCEVQFRGSDVVVKDLNSTNGSYINEEKITESVLKPGQTLRLGQIELKLEAEGAPAPPAKKGVESTMVMARGVSLSDLESGGRPPGLDTNTVFSKKKNKFGIYVWMGFGFVILVIIGLLLYALSLAKPHN
jgi:pSer/pThr/pTyr-binding forkhead associated (FHA) protein